MHQRMVGQETVRPRVLTDVGQPKPLAFIENDAQQSMTNRRRTDARALLHCDAGGDEGLNRSVGVDHRQRAEPRPTSVRARSTTLFRTTSRESSAVTSSPAPCSASSS